MSSEYKEGRILLTRTPVERAPLLNRLSRIEGQVRGLRQMIEQDRYAGDEVQQTNAIMAAIREVCLMIVSDHLDAGLACALDPVTRDDCIADMVRLLRTALKA